MNIIDHRPSNRADASPTLPAAILPAAVALALSACGGSSGFAPELPPVEPVDIGVEGFEQLVPRGAIAALVDPEFVPARDAEIPDDAWVLGYVAADGSAYAYDLNLLNHHEVVNHHAGGAPIAAVW